MSRTKLLTLIVLVSALALSLPACGGGSGSSASGGSTPLLVTGTSMPPMLSGEAFNYEVELIGGCGGPYVMRVIEGRLPAGLRLDNDTHSIVGTLLESGTFSFKLQIDDTGCRPSSSTTASYRLTVGVGDVVVVDVLQDGNPSIIPVGDTSYNPDYPALPKVVYNDFISLQFVVAGGIAPYSMKVYDDPNVDDGSLPLGVSVPTSSTSIVGSPVEVGPNGGAFLISFEVTDAAGRKGYLTAYWFIDTPVIIVASEDLNDGVCGEQYSDQFFVVEGVPPFTHDFVEDGLPADYTMDKNPNPDNPDADVLYNPGAPPTVTPATALDKIDATVYPAPDALGPNYDVDNQGAPPEGIVLDEDTGSFSGIPRRRGSFSVNYHVSSVLVPNSFGQHAWATFTFVMSPSGSFSQDPAYTVEGTFAQADPYSRIPEFEFGLVYNPDGGPAGLQLLASGGVPQDGITDAPHKSQVGPAPGETEGAYNWAPDWDPNSTGQTIIPHTEFLASGVYRVVDDEEDDLTPQGFQDMAFTVNDYALPTSLASTATEIVRTSVGPDTIVITESTNSFTLGNTTSANNRGMNDTKLDIKIMLPFASGAVVRALDDAKDLAGKDAAQHTIPETAGTDTELSDLLTDCDLIRATINPTGWWDDSMNFNPKAARGFKHGDSNKVYGYRALQYAYDYNYQSGSYTSTQAYGGNPATTSVRLPECTTPSVTEDRDAGIYTSGGKLYPFDSDKYIGVFIVRPESKLYVPIAFEKSTSGYKSFGDTWLKKFSSTEIGGPSQFKVPNMTVSPDGRFAAMKLSTSDAPSATYYYYGDRANVTDIVIFSLTGERIPAWDNETYTVIQTGANGIGGSSSSTTGEFLFAASLVLTNNSLYYVCGNSGYTTSEYYSWRYHWVYRYTLDSGDDAGALIKSASGDTQWRNTVGYVNAMQMPMQRYYRAGYSYGYSSGSYTYAVTYSDITLYNDGYNGYEGSKAPMPFRVNADGDMCVIIAGPTTTSSSSTIIHQRHVWVDDGSDIHRLSSTPRRILYGATRGTALTAGPNTSYTYQWGNHTGPGTQVAISDDGTKVAVVVNRYTSSVSYSTSGYLWGYAREDIVAFDSVNGTDWSSGATETQITGNDASTSVTFANPIKWRFGGLTFTKDGEGLVFWGGVSGAGPSTSSSSYYYESYSYYGSIYAYDFDSGDVIHLLAKADGGASDDQGDTYDTSNQVSYTASTTYSGNRNFGAIKPVGGFMEPNRNFYYIIAHSGLSTSKTEADRLIAINVRSLDNSQDINDHEDGLAFALGGSDWPSRRGFIGSYGYSASYWYGVGYYGIRYGYYTPSGQFGSMQAMTENGRVFFGAHWQVFSTAVATSLTYGGPNETTTNGDNNLHAGQVAFFDATVAGPVQLLSTMDETLVNGNYQSTTRRALKYVEPRDDGTSVAFVYCPNTGTYYSYPYNLGQETIGVISNIVTDETGEVTSQIEVEDIHGSAGRVSSSIAPDSSGSRYFYAFGTGDEAAKQMFVGSVGPDGGEKSALTGSTAKKRFNALHAGR